jgi:hypothetical protein
MFRKHFFKMTKNQKIVAATPREANLGVGLQYPYQIDAKDLRSISRQSTKWRHVQVQR